MHGRVCRTRGRNAPTFFKNHDNCTTQTIRRKNIFQVCSRSRRRNEKGNFSYVFLHDAIFRQVRLRYGHRMYFQMKYIPISRADGSVKIETYMYGIFQNACEKDKSIPINCSFDMCKQIEQNMASMDEGTVELGKTLLKNYVP